MTQSKHPEAKQRCITNTLGKRQNTWEEDKFLSKIFRKRDVDVLPIVMVRLHHR